ncbi:uncharacterized LabA/DUF88 family protein [Tumebacillus sp. BK434]|uniref:NYN domain-containing protein n=1 Tax=Tumebacillus sp. BK434 TaxID=2512169 RepID=UPI001046E8E1|nr:NYN domain-containing protein [Tumebacillus sp. BK434]TCP52403.1 uncharacterized LabA/DUF88 family protein [Tumebacillus sp. BK434]
MLDNLQGNGLIVTEPNGVRRRPTPSEMVNMLAETIGETAMKSERVWAKHSQLENVAIYVDYDNVYWTLKNSYLHDPDDKNLEKNLFTQLWNTYDRDNVRVFKAFGDFEQIACDMTSLQKKRIQLRHVYANGKKDEHRKNASDIELCLDAIETTYTDPNISCYVFVTADSDMIPIMSRLMYKGKHVELYYVPSATSKHYDITAYAHRAVDLLEFLNIQVKDYNIEDYIIGALEFIENWERKFQENPEVFLGRSWLFMKLREVLAIPESACSQLLEYLETKEYILLDNKKYYDKIKDENTMKKSYRLAKKGVQCLRDSQKESAASKEA